MKDIKLNKEKSILWKLINKNYRSEIIINGYEVNGCRIFSMIFKSLVNNFLTLMGACLLLSCVVGFLIILSTGWVYAIDYYFFNLGLDIYIYENYLYDKHLITSIVVSVLFIIMMMGIIIHDKIKMRSIRREYSGRQSRFQIFKEYLKQRKDKICPIVKFESDDHENVDDY